MTSATSTEAGTSFTVDFQHRAVWTTAYINDLPDSAFLYIEPGGSKDGEGKTTPRTLRHFPYKDAGGNVDLPHLRNALSRIPQSSLPDGVKSTLTAKAQRILAQNRDSEVPKEGYRAAFGDGLLELRSVDGGRPTLFGHFARFNEWAEIDSIFEGHFNERIAPGAFSKTFQENRSNMRVLFQHGRDVLGQQVLGQIEDLREDEEGAFYQVPLFESVPPLIVDGLRAGQYGSSFRFRVMKEEFNKRPEPSETNPDGIPERTITEAMVSEFGPVTFPAYAGATAGVRSITDEIKFGLDDPEKLRELLERAGAVALNEPEDEESRPTTRLSRNTPKPRKDYLSYGKEKPSWLL